MNCRSELHRIEVPPSSFWSYISSRTTAFAFRARQLRAAILNPNIHQFGLWKKLDISNTPVGIKSQQSSIMICG